MNVNTAQGTAPEQTHQRVGTDPSLSGLSFLGVLRSEFAKLMALRTTFWLSLISVVLSVLIAVAVAATTQSGDDEAWVAQGAVVGVWFAMMLLGSLAVIAMTTEFTSGSVRSSLAAVPRRSTLYLAKTLAAAVLIGLVTAVIVVLSHLVVVFFTDSVSMTAPFENSAVLHHYLANWASVVVTTVLSVGLGALLRSSAGGIVVLTVFLFVLQTVLFIAWGIMQVDWLQTLLDYEYATLIETFTNPEASDPGPLFGGIGMLIWAAVPFGLGWLAFVKRDV